MEQDGQVNAAALQAHIAAEQSHHKGIYALHHIAVENAEESCLENICGCKGHGFHGIFQSDAPENQFFADGGNQDRVQCQEQRHISKTDTF